MFICINHEKKGKSNKHCKYSFQNVCVQCLLSLWYSIKETTKKKELEVVYLKIRNKKSNFKRNVLNIIIWENLLEVAFSNLLWKRPLTQKRAYNPSMLQKENVGGLGTYMNSFLNNLIGKIAFVEKCSQLPY